MFPPHALDQLFRLAQPGPVINAAVNKLMDTVALKVYVHLCLIPAAGDPQQQQQQLKQWQVTICQLPNKPQLQKPVNMRVRTQERKGLV